MNLYEHEAADIFSGFGILVPERLLATTPDEAVAAAEQIGLPVVVKAQVLAGGRGLAGGVKTVNTAEEVQAVAADLLGSRIQGTTVRSVMVVRKVDFYRELYLGITVDGYDGRPLVMVSPRGGMNIEEVARRNPTDISSLRIDVDRGLFAFEARKLLGTAGFPARQIPACADTLMRLYQAFETYNAMVAEINPLVICTNESLMALDAKLEVDDASLFRTAKLIPKNHERDESHLEKLGREIGVTYVELNGDIGIISRSGTLSYEMAGILSSAGYGQSTVVGKGADPVALTTLSIILQHFDRDPETDGVVIVGEIGGVQEEEAAKFIAVNMGKPVAAYIAGKFSPEGKRMGHAGAIIRGSQGTFASKQQALQNANVTILNSPIKVIDWAQSISGINP